MEDTHLAVMDAPPTPQTREDLHQLVTAKETEYEALHAVYNDLWQQRKKATLGRDGYVDYLMCEDRMTLLLQELEHLKPQLRAAQVREAVQSAQQQHDEAVEAALALAVECVQALQSVAPLWGRLGEVFDAMATPLMGFRDAQGTQAFPFLSGGPIDALNLFTAVFGGDARAADAYRFLQTPLTVGHIREALANHPRLRAFPPRAITNYLTTTTEGVSNGHHG